MSEVYLTGLATRAGSEILNVEEIARGFGKSKRSLERCGTNGLHRFEFNDTLEGLTLEVAEKALKISGIDKDDVSGIYASICCPTSKYSMPGLARVIGRELFVFGIPMITTSMGCVGGIHAMQAAYNQLRVDSLNGKKGNALVIAGDHISRALDEKCWDTAGIFSDGVSAMVLSTEKKGDYLIKEVQSSNLHGDIYSMNIEDPSEDTRGVTFRMDGAKVFDFAYKETFPAILKLLTLRKLPRYCYFIPHQASGVVLKHMQKEHEIRDEQFYKDGIGSVGNMTSASVFFGLEDVMRRGIAGERDIILGAFGAELAVGAALLEYQGKRDSRNTGLGSVNIVLG